MGDSEWTRPRVSCHQNILADASRWRRVLRKAARRRFSGTSRVHKPLRLLADGFDNLRPHGGFCVAASFALPHALLRMGLLRVQQEEERGGTEACAAQVGGGRRDDVNNYNSTHATTVAVKV